MKLMNFRRLDPDQQGRGLAGGGKQEESVWAVFASNLPRLRSAAAAIAATVKAGDIDDDDSSPNADDGEKAEEGQILTRQHRIRERNRAIVERRKAKAIREHGRLHCEACDFDFTVRGRSAPTVKRHLAAVRMLFDWLVVGQVVPHNPAAAVRGPKHSIGTGKTHMPSRDEAKALIAAIETDSLIGLRDRAFVDAGVKLPKTAV